jgi:hypothetical protein
MLPSSFLRIALVFAIPGLLPVCFAQGTLADYQRAQALQAKKRDLLVNAPGAITWIGESNHFWYPRSVKGGTEFILVDAEKGSKKPAFDHDKLAVAISAISGRKYTGITLPFEPVGARRP